MQFKSRESLIKSHPDLDAGPNNKTTTDQYGNGIRNGHGGNKNGGDGLTEANGTNGAATTNAVPYATTGANGSIITMTLKNNHLIVETEERSVSAKLYLRHFCSTTANFV